MSDRIQSRYNIRRLAGRGFRGMITTVRPVMTPENEEARIAAVARYSVLDTEREEAFDHITALAARLLDAPISLMSIVDSDRIWVKSSHGVDVKELTRTKGMCSATILSDQPYLVTDAAAHPEWRDSPLVAKEGVRFYAGAPLRTPDGHALGGLSVADRKPRQATADELATLEDLASLAMHQLELRLSARPPAAESPGVSWEDPPQSKVRAAEDWAPLLAHIAQRPGHWAKLRHYDGETSAYRAAAQLRKRDDLPKGHWEFLARRAADGGSDLFARVSAESPKK